MKKIAFAVGMLLISSSAFADEKIQKFPGKDCVPNFAGGNHAGYVCKDAEPAEKPAKAPKKLKLKTGDTLRATEGKPIPSPTP